MEELIRKNPDISQLYPTRESDKISFSYTDKDKPVYIFEGNKNGLFKCISTTTFQYNLAEDNISSLPPNLSLLHDCSLKLCENKDVTITPFNSGIYLIKKEKYLCTLSENIFTCPRIRYEEDEIDIDGSGSSRKDDRIELREGQKIEARFGGRDKWLKGVIDVVNRDGTYIIRYEDGEKERDVKRDFIRTYKKRSLLGKSFREGDNVEVLVKNKYLKGTVVNIKSNGTYDIKLENNEKETTSDFKSGVNSDLIRSIERDTDTGKDTGTVSTIGTEITISMNDLEGFSGGSWTRDGIKWPNGDFWERING